jgi:hypothetical protein
LDFHRPLQNIQLSTLNSRSPYITKVVSKRLSVSCLKGTGSTINSSLASPQLPPIAFKVVQARGFITLVALTCSVIQILQALLRPNWNLLLPRAAKDSAPIGIDRPTAGSWSALSAQLHSLGAASVTWALPQQQPPLLLPLISFY